MSIATYKQGIVCSDMGKKIIPPHDPQRLNMILNEKQRQIGIDMDGLARQVYERRQKEVHASRARQEEDEEWCTTWQRIDSLYEEHEENARKRRYEYGRALKDQCMQKKACTEEKGAAVGIEKVFFDQFGTSHR